MAFQKDPTYAEIYSLRALTKLIEIGELSDPIKAHGKLEEAMIAHKDLESRKTFGSLILKP